MSYRTRKMTNVEFNNLDRVHGRILNLSEVFYLLTDKQVSLLHEDDWSYYHDLQEELAYDIHVYMHI